MVVRNDGSSSTSFNSTRVNIERLTQIATDAGRTVQLFPINTEGQRAIITTFQAVARIIDVVGNLDVIGARLRTQRQNARNLPPVEEVD